MNHYIKKTVTEKLHASIKLKALILFIGSIFFGTPVSSQNLDIQNCASIIDPTARLSCYDAYFLETQTTDQPEHAQKTPIVKKKLDTSNENNYGLEKQEDDLSITAKITNVTKTSNYKIYIDLDNKQTWRSVKDIYDRIQIKEGQTVSISKGFVSGYVMKVEGKKVSLRVRRVK
tara:strand:- start:1105 stop:1626 length:522 start_codon:yes stop_codon:yes gene_type:complete